MLNYKKIMYVAFPTMVAAFGLNHYLNQEQLSDREQSRKVYEEFLENHEFMNREPMTKKEWKSIPKKDRPDLAWEHDFIRTMDPALGYPTKEKLVDFMVKNQKAQNFQPRMALTPGSVDFPWEERGPSNVGGRTRAVMFDPNDSSYNKVWAGGVSGGLWYNDSIYNENSEWVNVSTFWENIPISAITYDPLNTDVFYVGTGEGFGGRSSVGAGIWKTTDGGQTWNILENTVDYKFVYDLAVHVENDTSRLYVACAGNYYSGTFIGSSGVYKSSDEGDSFTLVSGIGSNIGDFEISEVDSSLWASSSDAGNTPSGKIFLLNNQTGSWDEKHSIPGGDRVEIALSKTDSNVIYAVYEDNGVVGGIIKSADKGETWTSLNEPADPDGGIPPTDFSRGQAWYDLTIEVDPNNDSNIYVGGVNLHRSMDGGISWSRLTDWAGFGTGFIHADQHNIIFKPNSSDTCLFSNDGGVFYTKSLTYNSPAFYARNNGYNVTQFYAADLHGTSEKYLAGSQDNGTQLFSGAGFVETQEATGGDGAYCFIDKIGNQRYITSYVYNNYYESSNGVNYGTLFNGDGGQFINPAGYDDNLNILFTAKSGARNYRYGFNPDLPSEGLSDFYISGQGTQASVFSISPYTTDSTVLFIGTLGGKIIRVDGVEDDNYTRTFLHVSAMPNATVSSIAFGQNEDEILVTFSNYGVASVWHTTNGGTTWRNIEGNLPNFPVRSSLMYPFHNNKALLATELGIWKSEDIFADTVVWEQSINGLQNVRVDMLRTRPSDNKIVAATFGRGLFTSTFEGTTPAEAIINASQTSACLDEEIELTSNSINFIDSIKWDVSPSGFTYVNGSDTANNITLEFNASGSFNVQLIAYSVNGNDTLNQTIEIAQFNVPQIQRDFDLLICSETGDAYQWILNGTDIPGATNQTYTMSANGTYRVKVTYGEFCELKSLGLPIQNVDITEYGDLLEFDYLQSTSEVTIKGSDIRNYNVNIVNVLGQQVNNTTFMGQTIMDLQSLDNGIYVISVYEGNKLIAHKKISKN